MLPQLLALLVCSALQVTATPYKSQATIWTTADNDGCPTLRTFATRGTMEDPGAGAMHTIVERILKDIPGSDNVSTVYPAGGITIGPDKQPIYNAGDYIASVQQGRKQLYIDLLEFYDSCPKSDIVVMGYSQGAHVSGDVLCGSTFPLFPIWLPLAKNIKANIKAVITLGDPRNNKHTPTHVGNSTKSGLFPRTTFKYCGDDVVSSWRTYCDDNDVFCDHGKSTEAHLHYVPTYFDDIVEHVEAKVNSFRIDL